MENNNEIKEDSKEEKKIPAFRGPEKEYITGFLDDPKGTTVELSDIREQLEEELGDIKSIIEKDAEKEDDFDYEFDDVSETGKADDKVDYVSEDVASRLIEREMEETGRKKSVKPSDDDGDTPDNSDNPDDSKPGFWTKVKADIKPLLAYFAFFAGLIVADEVLLRFIVSRKIGFANLWFILFVPAEAALLTTF